MLPYLPSSFFFSKNGARKLPGIMQKTCFFFANANTLSPSFSIYQLVAWPIDCKCAAFGSGVPMVARHRTYLDGPTEQTKIVFCIFDRVPFCTLCTLSMYPSYSLAFIRTSLLSLPPQFPRVGWPAALLAPDCCFQHASRVLCPGRNPPNNSIRTQVFFFGLGFINKNYYDS